MFSQFTQTLNTHRHTHWYICVTGVSDRYTEPTNVSLYFFISWYFIFILHIFIFFISWTLLYILKAFTACYSTPKILLHFLANKLLNDWNIEACSFVGRVLLPLFIILSRHTLADICSFPQECRASKQVIIFVSQFTTSTNFTLKQEKLYWPEKSTMEASDQTIFGPVSPQMTGVLTNCPTDCHYT